MYKCPKCNSLHINKKGSVSPKSGPKLRFRCMKCLSNFYIPYEPEVTERSVGLFKEVLPTKEIQEPVGKARTWVITSALNDSETNTNFLKSLKNYCSLHDAELLIVPIKYNTTEIDYSWDEDLYKYFITTNSLLTKDLRLYAGMNISPTASNPLSGIDSYSKGLSLIFASPQIMMKTIPVNHIDYPAIVYTTGCISKPVYTSSKAGEKATFNHSYAALVVEEDLDIDSFHIRVLNSDESGEFYDLDMFYSGYASKYNNSIPAIVLGDEHVIHLDKSVSNATFYNQNSMKNVLNPEYLIRHDVLDFHSMNHHHNKDDHIKFQKYVTGMNNVEKELWLTMDYIHATSEGCKSIIVDSNHNRFFDRWLKEANPKNDDTNVIFYHLMKYLTLKYISDNNDITNPFELWYNNFYKAPEKNVYFVTDESFKIHDIEVGLHGDIGISGSKGSTAQFSRLGHKVIHGHSHVPNIIFGAYCVGTSSKLKLDYNKGPSGWHHAHCLVQPNGKRQMVFINNGKWRR